MSHACTCRVCLFVCFFLPRNPYLDPKDVYTTGNLLFYMNTISRNKRVVLAYLNERLRRVKQMWWDFGGELPPEREEPMHGHETLFFTQYNDLLEEYNFGCGTDISKVSLASSPRSSHTGVARS